MGAKKKTFKKIYDIFQSPVTTHDCGKECAKLNDGEPVCCTTSQAVPVADRAEWKLLKSIGNLWKEFTPYDDATHEIVDELHENCIAIECKGAFNCKRDQRSLACRAFPFFPYVTKDGEFVGLSFYWGFEDRCWVLSHTKKVEKAFIKEFVQAYDILFAVDELEFEVYRDYSATMRRVFSRWDRPISVIGRDGSRFKVLPKGGGLKPSKKAKKKKKEN